MKIILIGHPRSGTNSLVEILQCQPNLHLINEPFADDFASWNPSNVDYRARLNRGEPFDGLLNELFDISDGIKELSYQLAGGLLQQITHRPDVRVITLRRRNLLQTAVSLLLAERTGIWKRWDAEAPPSADRFGRPYPAVGSERVGQAISTAPNARLTDHYTGIDALDVDLVRERMEWTAREITRIDEAVAGVDALNLVYEDMYLGPLESRRNQVEALWRFLGIPSIESSRIDFFLSDAVRQAGKTTYGRVPDIALVEAALGSDATGHLSV